MIKHVFAQAQASFGTKVRLDIIVGFVLVTTVEFKGVCSARPRFKYTLFPGAIAGLLTLFTARGFDERRTCTNHKVATRRFDPRGAVHLQIRKAYGPAGELNLDGAVKVHCADGYVVCAQGERLGGSENAVAIQRGPVGAVVGSTIREFSDRHR